MIGTVLTKEGKAELEAELLHLETVRRQEVAKRIEVARGFGDLSENSEYDDAKNEQGWIESRITELKYILDGAQVAEVPKRPTKVEIGTRVTIKAVDGDKEISYNIVGSAEAESSKGNISNESPIGSALSGHKKGDIVIVSTPRGEKKFEITSLGAAK
ncbi:MAG: transcription elongation factor GreA [Coriobacteriia bacterium]|nr:transcription elongation factor GreA [Coriobacteriia bacterium]MCL2871044.1 transcription elongation factor GreA [Coriobacteriia bacterium]